MSGVHPGACREREEAGPDGVDDRWEIRERPSGEAWPSGKERVTGVNVGPDPQRHTSRCVPGGVEDMKALGSERDRGAIADVVSGPGPKIGRGRWCEAATAGQQLSCRRPGIEVTVISKV